MATRFHFTTTAPAVAPSSWSVGWNKTTGTATDISLSTGAGVDSSLSNAGFGTSGNFTAIVRAVSLPLTAQTVSGSVKGQILCLESNSADNYQFAFAIKVIQPDGTDRGVLVGVSAADAIGTPPEMEASPTAPTNRRWQNSAEAFSISLSSVSASRGDRIVIELGFRQTGTSTGNGQVTLGSGSDLAESTSGTSGASWAEFTGTFAFADEYFASASTPAGIDPAAIGVADPTAVTPPSDMLAGDLVCMIGHQRAAAATLAVSAAGGQTWTSETAISTTNVTARLFWCVFNGTWGANPSVDFSAATCNSVQLHVFRPATTGHTWSVNQAQVELDIAAGTGVHTITGQTTTGSNITVTLAGWFTADDNQWGTLSGTGWLVAGDAWYANTSGSDQSSTYAYKRQSAAGATGNVTKTQSLNGPDASTSFIITFAATGGGAPAAKSLAFRSRPNRNFRQSF